MKFIFTLFLSFLALSLSGQDIDDGSSDQYPKPTPASERIASMTKKIQAKKSSHFKNLKFKNVGPTIMSGRVTDIDASPKDPTNFYVAFASGGLWKTNSNGMNFSPLFEQEHSMTIGDIAVDWKNDETIWLGSGENNSSRSSYAGTGMYKSTDKGKTWQWLGLGDSHHIGRIIIHPNDKNTVWVAALGHLYSPNQERGVFKTTDGGKTWEKVLFVGENTGAIDLEIDPKNSNVLYAAMWHRWRRSWHFQGAGEKSGIYKTTDGGKSWNKITVKGSGFPISEGVGRIGLAVSKSQPNTLYAILDNQDLREKQESKKGELTKNDLRNMTTSDFLKQKDETINQFLDKNQFPKKYTAKSLKAKIKAGTLQVKVLVEFLENANALLFDTPVKGAELYRSDDGGKSWKKTHDKYIDDTFYSYGYYFAQVRVAPDDPNRVYVLGVPILRSKDGGKTWKSIGKDNVHADHHALFINPNQSKHLINGNDGGVNISYDDGETWHKANHIPVGQFYDIHIDNATPYRIYGGLQDNGVWYGSKNYRKGFAWHQEGKYPYQRIMGGDGMQTMVDKRDNNIIYTGWQFGNYYRLHKTTGKQTRITPKHTLGERPFRFNWQTPILLSEHNQDILYMGSHKFHRSLDKGKTFETLSGDLTTGGKKGNVPFSTISVIEESPLQFGLIYVGTDDGQVHISTDLGNSWKEISSALPSHFWVTRVKASQHKKERVYVTLNGYRWDHFQALVYVSEDMGKTWKQLGKDLPLEPVNAFEEDSKNENVLYVGTDNGLYISTDGGATFGVAGNEFPNVAVHDLELHEKDKELVVGTHGRSIFITSVKEVQKMTAPFLKKDIHLFAIDTLQKKENWGNSWSRWHATDPDPVVFSFYSKSKREITLTMTSENQTEIFNVEIQADKGLNYFDYDLEVQKDLTETTLEQAHNGKYYIPAGIYTVSISTNTSSVKQSFVVKPVKKKSRE